MIRPRAYKKLVYDAITDCYQNDKISALEANNLKMSIAFSDMVLHKELEPYDAATSVLFEIVNREIDKGI